MALVYRCPLVVIAGYPESVNEFFSVFSYQSFARMGNPPKLVE
jgi:hypothetical protein